MKNICKFCSVFCERERERGGRKMDLRLGMVFGLLLGNTIYGTRKVKHIWQEGLKSLVETKWKERERERDRERQRGVGGKFYFVN